MDMNNLYYKLKVMCTDNELWWLYVTLKRDLAKNNKFKDYIDEDIKMTNEMLKIRLNSLFGESTFTEYKNLSHSSNIKDVIFNEPATIILWNDNTKTVVKCQNGEPFDKEKGFALAYLKKLLGNDNTFNKEIRKWVE